MSDRNEWERDAAVWLAGRHIERTGRHEPPPTDPRLLRAAAGFAAWRAAVEREEAAARFAHRVRQRIAAHGPGIRRVDGIPCSMSAPAGPVAPMLEAARRAHAAPLVELGVAAGTGRELLDEPCEAWVALPPDLAPGRYMALHVVGDSMVPLLHSGDVVLVDLDGAVVPGAVAVVRHPRHGHVVKRVGAVQATGLRLESLNPTYPPMTLAPGAGSLIGRVVLRWCAHGPSKPALAPAP